MWASDGTAVVVLPLGRSGDLSATYGAGLVDRQPLVEALGVKIMLAGRE